MKLSRKVCLKCKSVDESRLIRMWIGHRDKVFIKLEWGEFRGCEDAKRCDKLMEHEIMLQADEPIPTAGECLSVYEMIKRELR